MTKVSSQTVHIVGGGISGLSCAWYLQRHAVDFRILEASDAVGGRMRTDDVDGFRLDRGFQVFQTAYPEARAVLDYGKLDLVPLVAGALVRSNSKWIPQVDPFRHPSYALGTVFNRLGTLSDRLKLVRLLWDVWRTPLAALSAKREDKSTSELLLADYGVSAEYVDRFLRPWLSGIFLESELATSANFFKFVLKMLSSGKICYPRAGIQAIPDQLAAGLPDGSLELNCPVHRRGDGEFEYVDGRTLNDEVVLAVPMHQAALMADQQDVDRGSVSTTCVYFAANRPPVESPILMLNGDGDGPANHVFVLTNASPQLAPKGKALISVSLIGDLAYDRDELMSQLRNWYGEQVKEWSELAVYRIENALPKQAPSFNERATLPENNGFSAICGDYCETASLQGALASGRMAAEKIAATIPKDA